MSAAVFVVAGSVAEFSVRLLRPEWRPPPARGVPFLRPDPRLGWRLREGWQGPFALPHRSTQVVISEQGLRDESYAPHPAPGRRRVLLLGDSFAWGFGVEKQETFEKLLEDRLGDVDVVNGAVPGFGTDQELLLLEEQGLGFHPNLVLLLFHANDLLNNTWPRQYGYSKPVFRMEGSGLRLENVPVPGGRLYELGMRTLRRSFILHELWRRTMEPTQDLHASPKLAWDVTERLLVRMRDTSTKNGARFAVITFPWVDDATNRLLARVREIIDRNRLTHIDLGPAFSGRISALLDPVTQHWTPEGHRAVADALAPALSDLLGNASEPAPDAVPKPAGR
ncbi:MAG: SGNH/GDSL hydrolase family protein [Thermoanaerobaculia bacterium]|nr:SGNH/GDSL hydrolase family protein [Thermoanaerobaculia bacterium]